jgi:DNA-binding NarL/FixJ family response regulator
LTAVALLAHPGVYRDALGRALKLTRELHVARIGDPTRATTQDATQEADVVVLDACRLNLDEIAGVLAPPAPSSRLLLIVTPTDREIVVVAATKGVKSFIPASGRLSELVNAIRTISSGGFYCPSEITEILLSRLSSHESNPEAALTHRESEVVGLLARGLSNKEIGRALGIALPTVKNHVHAVLEKVNARNRTEASQS